MRLSELGATKHEFQVILADVSELTEEISNDLFESGCDDGTPFSRDGVAAVGFSRSVDPLESAIRSAINDVSKAGYTVTHVESADEPVFSQINKELPKQS